MRTNLLLISNNKNSNGGKILKKKEYKNGNRKNIVESKKIHK
jgi:hypothetical protein